MASTLTWRNSGLVTKTGTTALAFFNDMNTIVTSKAGDANFKWQVASFSTAGNPYYLTLKRKDGSAGRILYLNYTGAPAGNNSAILEGIPTTGALMVCYFPSGNVDTPSNLAASSGTIMGDDTGCIKACVVGASATIYTTSVAAYYFDSEEAVYMMWGHAGTTSHSGVAAGNIIVDGNDVAYPAVMTAANNSFMNFGNSTSPPIPWTGSDQTAGNSSTAYLRTNYGSADRLYFMAFAGTGNWLTQSIGPSDPATDVTNTKVMFTPILLVGGFNSAGAVTKGEGLVLKLRQFAHGPQSRGQFDNYNTTGPVAAALCPCPSTSTAAGCAWFTNFKV